MGFIVSNTVRLFDRGHSQHPLDFCSCYRVFLRNVQDQLECEVIFRLLIQLIPQCIDQRLDNLSERWPYIFCSQIFHSFASNVLEYIVFGIVTAIFVDAEFRAEKLKTHFNWIYSNLFADLVNLLQRMIFPFVSMNWVNQLGLVIISTFFDTIIFEPVALSPQYLFGFVFSLPRQMLQRLLEDVLNFIWRCSFISVKLSVQYFVSKFNDVFSFGYHQWIDIHLVFINTHFG